MRKIPWLGIALGILLAVAVIWASGIGSQDPGFVTPESTQSAAQ